MASSRSNASNSTRGSLHESFYFFFIFIRLGLIVENRPTTLGKPERGTRIWSSLGTSNDDDRQLGIWDHLYEWGGRKIFVHEDFDAGLGGTLFDGALLLCNYLELFCGENAPTRDLVLRGSTVLELGRGLRCSRPVHIDDWALRVAWTSPTSSRLLSSMEENVESNQREFAKWAENNDAPPPEVNAFVLDWFETERNSRSLPSYDVILAADTIYERKAVEPFVRAVLESSDLESGETVMVFAHPKPRIPDASEFFWRLVLEDKVFGDDVVRKIETERLFGYKSSDVATNGLFLIRIDPHNKRRRENEFVPSSLLHGAAPASARHSHAEIATTAVVLFAVGAVVALAFSRLKA